MERRQTDDALLVRRCLNGDREAFSELVRAHQNTALATALSYVRDPDNFRDVVQDLFIVAYTGHRDLKRPEKFGVWLRGIVRTHSVPLGAGFVPRDPHRHLRTRSQHPRNARWAATSRQRFKAFNEASGCRPGVLP